MTGVFGSPLAALVVTFLLITSAKAEEPAPDCWEASRHVYVAAPDLVYDGMRDSLFTLVQDWQGDCGFNEPALRLSILAAIWDEAFTEEIYDATIMDALIWRYDDGRDRRVSGEVDPSWAPGGIATEADFAAGIEFFDTFTSDFADQLLPHTPDASLERFFCLYYSGDPEAAWDLLEGPDLGGTDLRWYHQRELSILSKPSPTQIVSVGVGQWLPEGDLARFGNQLSLAASAEIRSEGFLARGFMELRPGRSRYPYLVDRDGITGYSDRFNNTLLGVELGREMVAWDRHRLDVYAGIAYDSILPLKDADLALWTVNLSYGAGYRMFMGEDRNWLLGFDYRREHVGSRGNEGTELSGDAITYRFSVGFVIGGEKDRRMKGLGQ